MEKRQNILLLKLHDFSFGRRRQGLKILLMIYIITRTSISSTYPIFAQQGYENPREVTGCFVCANCHLANKPVDIEVPQAILLDTDVCSLNSTIWRYCSFIQTIDFTSITGLSQNPKCGHTFNEHIIELVPSNSIKNNIDGGDGQSSEDTIIALPLDSYFNGIEFTYVFPLSFASGLVVPDGVALGSCSWAFSGAMPSLHSKGWSGENLRRSERRGKAPVKKRESMMESEAGRESEAERESETARVRQKGRARRRGRE
ncbi:hypothetical protein LguiA_027205 [Lonicera macranthoides]